MNQKLADLVVNKSEDYNDTVVKALEDAGFVVVMDTETSFEISYIVARAERK